MSKNIKKTVCLGIICLLLTYIHMPNSALAETFDNSHYSVSGFDIRFQDVFTQKSIRDTNENLVVKIDSGEEYNEILRLCGIEETSLTSIPSYTAIIPCGNNVLLYSIHSDKAFTRAELANKVYSVYLEKISYFQEINELMEKQLTDTVQSVYIGHGFNFGSDWETNGVWRIDEHILNGKPSLFLSSRDLVKVYDMTMTLFLQASNGRFFAHLGVINIVFIENFRAKTLDYHNQREYNEQVPCSYYEYSPHSSVGSHTYGLEISFGGDSNGSISFGASGSMSETTDDVRVFDTSDILGNNTVDLNYTFDGSYARGTIWLNHMVIAKLSPSNPLDNMGMTRRVILNTVGNMFLGYSYNWTVFTKTFILFRP